MGCGEPSPRRGDHSLFGGWPTEVHHILREVGIGRRSCRFARDRASHAPATTAGTNQRNTDHGHEMKCGVRALDAKRLWSVARWVIPDKWRTATQSGRAP